MFLGHQAGMLAGVVQQILVTKLCIQIHQWNNTAVGQLSLYFNTLGDGNTAVGEGALYYNSTSNNNTAVGAYSLDNNTTGSSNTAIGRAANVSAGLYDDSYLGSKCVSRCK